MQDEIEAIRREIEEYKARQAEVQARIRALQAEEDPTAGVFKAEEIHETKQEKLRLDFEIQYRNAKINRLRFGGE